MSDSLDVFAGALKAAAKPQNKNPGNAGGGSSAPQPQQQEQPRNGGNGGGNNKKKFFNNKNRGNFGRGGNGARQNASPIRGANGEESVNPLLNAPLPTEAHDAEPAPANPNRNPDLPEYRLADIQTGGPIYFRNEPVGSTATIISEMYQERGLMPPAKLAGLIAAAIVADTVMFKSPTSTAVDRRMADRMARIANISLEELGQTIFSASISDDKPADVLLFTDFKDFHIADHDFGVSQITCVDSNRMMQRKDEFLSVMRKTMEERGYTLMILMLTDVLLEGTHLLYLGDEDIITQAFGVQLKDHTCFLPGVVSRKKQVIPSLTALWG